jgi:hypothetical protein
MPRSKELSTHQQNVLLSYSILVCAVPDGLFQYLFGSGWSDAADKAVSALKKIGAEPAAKIFTQAILLAKKARRAHGDDKKILLKEKGLVSEFKALDRQLRKDKPNIIAALSSYSIAHEKQIFC